jgi:hypothetical protein
MMTIQTAIQPVAGSLSRCFTVCIAILLVAGCGSGPTEDILNRMSGTWVTDAAGYERARIEISREKVTFYAVDETVSENRITDIQHAIDKNGDLLTIEYHNRYGQKYLLAVYLLATSNGDALVKKNQQHIIWKKAPGDL